MVTTLNKPQRNTTMHPKTLIIFSSVSLVCCFAIFFRSSTILEFAWDWCYSLANIFFNSMIFSSYKQILFSFVATFNFSSSIYDNEWFTSTLFSQPTLPTLLPVPPLLSKSWFNDFFKSSSQIQNLQFLTSCNHKQKQFKIIEHNTTPT